MDVFIYALLLGICLGWLARALGQAVLKPRLEARRERRALPDAIDVIEAAHEAVWSPLSWPSEQVLKEYNALPESSRTYGDITETLRALDTKHDRSLLNGHFYLPACEFGEDVSAWGGGYSWIGASQMQVDPNTGSDIRHEHHGCIGSEHYALHVAIQEIKKAIRDKEKAIELAGIQHELGQVPSLLEALQIEAEANRP